MIQFPMFFLPLSYTGSCTRLLHFSVPKLFYIPTEFSADMSQPRELFLQFRPMQKHS